MWRTAGGGSASLSHLWVATIKNRVGDVLSVGVARDRYLEKIEKRYRNIIMKYYIDIINQFTKTIAIKRVSATKQQRNHIPGGGKSPGIWWN
jgi:hypothetical protein